MGPRWRKTKGHILYAWVVCLLEKHMETVSGWVAVNMAFGMEGWAQSGSFLSCDWLGLQEQVGGVSEVKRPKGGEEKKSGKKTKDD